MHGAAGPRGPDAAGGAFHPQRYVHGGGIARGEGPCLVEEAMRRAWVVTVLSSGLAAAGCPAPSLHDVIDVPPTTTDGAPAPTTEEPAPTSSASDGVVTTTDSPSTGGGPVDETGDGTGEPAVPPVIDEVVFDPDPLVAPGPIAVTVSTEFTAAVKMAIDGGPAVALAPAGPDLFTGALVFQSYLSNGTYSGQFVPYSGKRAGIAVTLPFAVNLPHGGGEIFWEAIEVLGEGQVAALTVLPDGDVVEFGTLTASSQCYLRRRRSTGGWMKEDVRLLPDTPCAAVDVAATEDGALYLLANLVGQGDLSWWLGRAPSFEAEPSHVGFGAPNEAAYALARAPDRVAVCGTRPTVKADVDAAVWIFPFGQEGSSRAFDYVPPGSMDPHTFLETPRDCVFAGDRLVLAGEANGKHDWDNLNAPDLDRLFVLEYTPKSQAVTWTVDGDPEDLTTQSGTRALTVDPQGGYLVGGHRCGKPCAEKAADLRRYAPGGALTWSLELAPQISPARALAWHPGGYVVLVSAVTLAPWKSAFFVQAWKPGQYPALWSYDKNVLPTLHEGTAVIIGPFGQVYTGGRGADGYPAVAFIYG